MELMIPGSAPTHPRRGMVTRSTITVKGDISLVVISRALRSSDHRALSRDQVRSRRDALRSISGEAASGERCDPSSERALRVVVSGEAPSPDHHQSSQDGTGSPEMTRVISGILRTAASPRCDLGRGLNFRSKRGPEIRSKLSRDRATLSQER